MTCSSLAIFFGVRNSFIWCINEQGRAVFCVVRVVLIIACVWKRATVDNLPSFGTVYIVYNGRTNVRSNERSNRQHEGIFVMSP